MTEQPSAQTFMHRYYLPIRMLQNSHCKAIIMHTPQMNLNEALHKPTYRVTAGASYNLYKKFIFNLDMIVQGGMKAIDYNDIDPVYETITLDAAFDLSFRTEYLISDTFSAFVLLNNIASSKYPLFIITLRGAFRRWPG
jgi:hypothetical protein